MSKRKDAEEVPMIDLNAEITVASMNLLKLAKLVTNRPMKELVQEAIDKWLAAQGITPDKMPTAPKPKR